MSNKKQISIYWLLDKMITKKHTDSELNDIFNKAKAMHKEETIDAIIESEKEHYSNAEVYPPEFVLRKAEKYYNETFGGDNE